MTNPIMQFMQMVRSGGNPEAMMMNMLQQKVGNSPMGQNLLKMAQNNDGEREHTQKEKGGV